MSGRTQKDRVLEQLRRNRRGITAIDFSLPDVIDGGAPLTRLAARIGELIDDGHVIAGDGRRGGCKVYVLKVDACPPRPQAVTTRLHVAGRPLELFPPADSAERPAGPYDDVEAA